MASPSNEPDDSLIDTTEQELFASLDASVQEQAVYEETVLRQATHQLAPTLSGVGFPPMACLAPSYTASRPDQYNPSDLPHVHSVLHTTRQQQLTLAKTQSSNATEQQNLGYLKEQMLLSFLAKVAQVATEELPVRRREEQATEQERSRALQQAPLPPLATSSSQQQPHHQQQPGDRAAVGGSGKKRARIPMMKRKRHEQQSNTLSTAGTGQKKTKDVDAARRQKDLQRVRLERQRRKELRRRASVESSDGSTSEEEMELDDDNELLEMSDNCVAEEKKEEASAFIDDTVPVVVAEKEQNADSIPTVACPLCQEEVATPDPSQVDAALSQHMDECQRTRRPSRRSSRATTAIKTYKALPENWTDPARSNRRSTRVPPKKGAKTSKKKTYVPKVRASPPSIDDLEEWVYEDRVDNWTESGLSRMKDMKERDADDIAPGSEEYDGGLFVPDWINDRLFGYQRTGVKWMWDLHQQEAGGCVGDEMGLGKTVQLASFLGMMAASRKLKSVVIIAPATMLQHWLNELAVWAPGLRRILIHSSGESDGLSRTVSPALLGTLANWLRQARADRVNEAIDEDDWETGEPHTFCGTGYAVLTTYENIRRNPETWISHNWSYVVMDEAQKIRNPDADVTLACKRFRTPHRLALSGTPIQNDLKELWSLLDFVFPGRLGTLPAFEQEFADPIKRGGYSNATPMQVQLAYRCALVLRDLINPYLLRRQKKDVKEVSRMPGKTEHVLFCRLSQQQRMLYESFLRSDEVLRVMRGSAQMFAAITMLRKICDHPDLACSPDNASIVSFMKNGYVNEAELNNEDSCGSDDDNGDTETLMERSGKLEVLSKILPLWHKQGHRVLIFCQWRKTLNIIQRFTQLQGWKFGRLDGNTNVSARQRLVDEFNSDESYFGMLCTTRTGGVGLNLTGANRIIIYSPDWNPQTDAQARERAWRFGQEREVTVYRLITAGTVEEKIYQRQIFKTALSNKILQDPRQRRLFSQRDLKDLFTLKADTGSVRSGGDGLTETGAVTRGVGVIDPDMEPAKETSRDDKETMKTVLKSKGLAGVFDHHFLDPDSSRKSVTAREMEEQAKQVARDAANALRESTASQKKFSPTWTGSNETAHSRFGSSNAARKVATVGGGASAILSSSSSLLASLRQRNTAVKTGGSADPPSQETKQYAKLLSRIQEFVRYRRPSTDEILQEFDAESSLDAAIFRRLLKSVASLDKGRWYLTSK